MRRSDFDKMELLGEDYLPCDSNSKYMCNGSVYVWFDLRTAATDEEARCAHSVVVMTPNQAGYMCRDCTSVMDWDVGGKRKKMQDGGEIMRLWDRRLGKSHYWYKGE